MDFHHIGVATTNIGKSIEVFEKLGFISQELVFDEIQNVNICFLVKAGHPDIELIEPVNEKSPVRNILDKVGTTPYHFCYSTNDIIKEISNLKEKKFLLAVKPFEAKAIGNRKICFCYHPGFGLIELLEIM
jgi:methylmalonyl-CoA/ethylmalonyl-CoA epimerase